MTATEQWQKDGGVVIGGTHATLEEALIDPTAWEAVGKTRGWYVDTKCRENHPITYEGTCMMFKWHQFIDSLAIGKSIEEALSAISK